MKKFVAYIVLFFTILFTAAYALGGEGHGNVRSSYEFRIDTAEVKLKIEPATFIKGKTPEISVALTDSMSGNPILDAEIYLYLQDASTSATHAGHTAAPVVKNSIPGEDGLDFGSAPEERPSYDLSYFARFKASQMAGIYSTSYPITKKGDYKFIIAVKSLGGKSFAEPLIYGGTMPYREASKIPLYRMWFVAIVIFSSGLLGIWILSQRKSLALPTGQSLNLLDIPWIKKFFKSSWFQPVFQIPAFLLFFIIIAAGLLDVQQGDRNIATLSMWTIWWAAIIFTFVFAGRVWCMMCPFGAAQDRLGRLFSLNKNFPKPVRNIWLSSFIFFGLTWWDSYSGIVNKPALTSYLLIGFFIAAVGMAVTFKGRSFCRYVCPIGGIIGLYSMFSPVELRNKCLEVCRGHEAKECVKGAGNGLPCPMFVTPMTLDRNNYCNFCSECIKSCSQDNIVVRVRSFAKDLWVSAKRYMDEAYLAMVLVGLTIVVTGEMVEPWHKWMDVIGKAIPYKWFGIASHTGAEKLTFLIVMTVGSLVIPLSLLAFAAFAVRKATGPESPLPFKETIIRFAYMFIPVGLSMHLAHNVSHLFKEGPGIIPAIQRAAALHLGLNMGEPDWDIIPLMGAESILWLQMAIFMMLNVFSLYAGYRIAVKYYGDKAMRAFIPMAALAVFFMMLNTYILGQPMSPRHGH